MVMKGEWIKQRWVEFRWGFNYMGLGIGLYNLLVLTAIVLGVRGGGVIALLLYVTGPFVFGSIMLGMLHRKYQLQTDAVLAIEPLLKMYEDMFRKIVREELDRHV